MLTHPNEKQADRAKQADADTHNRTHRRSKRLSLRALTALAPAHRTPFATFGLIGAAIFALGLPLQALLVQVWHANRETSYLAIGLVSIEVNFLFNRWFTWRDRLVTFWMACYRFNAQKAVTASLNLFLYSTLVSLGTNYLIANLATATIFTVVNYMLGHFWSFSPRNARSVTSVADPPARTFAISKPPPTVSVSVIVPCKNNARTIRATVESLLRQDYPGLQEVILVGSTADSTWISLQGVTDPRLIILEQEQIAGRRDPAIKRDKGLQKATGEILALVDSDIVMKHDWLSKAVTMLTGQGDGCVAGGMQSIENNFWGRFIDRNVLSAKTPRVQSSYLVHQENFGRRGTKPPITANAVFFRNVYESCPIDVKWTFGYEDYEWFWRVVCAGHKILVSDLLNGQHHHRRSFHELVREYLRASAGCARFIRAHPSAPLARKRLSQGILIPLLMSGTLAIAGIAAWEGYGGAVAVAAGLALGLLSVREFMKSRTIESLAYPVISLTLCFAFVAGLIVGLLTSITHAPAAPLVQEGHAKLSLKK